MLFFFDYPSNRPPDSAKEAMKVKLAAKMLVIAWTLMKNKELFNPEHVKID